MHWRNSQVFNNLNPYWLRYLCVLWVLGLTACGEQIPLYAGLAERQANEMVTELASQQIDSYKTTHKDGTTVSVSRENFAFAMRTLNSKGLPSQIRSNLGQVFRKESLVSTPLEERARYIHALSQELETTLTQIEGVTVARVHVVLAERVAPGQPVMPASAAVFIKHTSQVEPDVLRPRVQRMVASSIPGLGALANSISVVLVPAARIVEPPHLVSWGPFELTDAQIGLWRRVILGLLGFTALSAIGIFAHWKRREYMFQQQQITQS
ncbi:Type III secretion bridge between inner and outermembrane lipoprotein (YscJ,HrcJ,EscJ, PscJ) [Pseudomonas synxantha]|uniref:Lipoprotein n=1 Tax=Pseudomonas synxantha TaxID=47883 RepID=A0A3G7UC16_9PSED|nr:type III secretion inner membrane ring lipoprotein SctJ [Pseudomonas synxantha]AZE56890.1 Type III secretion bridge between inner and outermembrane lipoprotein (YscJ,HrcJ,EscJ, PscJ) [Pseudomonas synxantha]